MCKTKLERLEAIEKEAAALRKEIEQEQRQPEILKVTCDKNQIFGGDVQVSRGINALLPDGDNSAGRALVFWGNIEMHTKTVDGNTYVWFTKKP